MKSSEFKIFRGVIFSATLLLAITLGSFKTEYVAPYSEWNGAYISDSRSDTTYVILIADNYFSYTAYNVSGKQFYFTWGGPLQQDDDQVVIPVEFNSLDKAAVGQMLRIQLQRHQQGVLFFGHLYEKVNASASALAGCWRIAGRMQDGNMNEIKPGPRRTLKMLTNNRFQWMAINIDTGEFFGTGGGDYSFKDGIYTENIQFFSRDSSRVGQSLSFQGKVDNGQWHHSGKSSKGDPISEVWVHLNE